MIELTEYYQEFLRYHEMATKQQAACNLGSSPYEGVVDDDLMTKVHLYDVVNRKYAGFSQLINDCFYGWSTHHPYWPKMEAGNCTVQRLVIAKNWMGKRFEFNLADWLYVFIVHRITGSGINYAKKPSGYNNTIVPELYQAKNIAGMADIIRNWKGGPFYTSVGYQFPAFPKPKDGYKRGGDYFLCELAPDLARQVAEELSSTVMMFDYQRLTLRDVGNFMFDWNSRHGLRAYRFQYAAVIADIADWFPDLVDKTSHFYYGSNARECIKYLAKPVGKMKEDDFLDEVMDRIREDTGRDPYDAEDICCDFIRWVENYVRPGGDYDHVDRDAVFSSCRIKDHPFGRQKAMLDLGLIESFNAIPVHPSDDYIISRAGLTAKAYKEKVNGWRNLVNYISEISNGKHDGA